MQKLQDVHEAYQVLAKVICSIHHTSRGIEMFFLQSVPCRPGDPCKEADQEGDPGEEGVRGHSGGGRHLQEENVGHQVEHLVSKKHSQSRIAMENLCHCICNCQCVKFAAIESIDKRAQTQT